ncbi:MAG: hypothetical protein OXT67_07545, partial [Zetaproteobacteria bacterium]|nr:hypothetical protein [Zetaproteobacteria bacterium]
PHFLFISLCLAPLACKKRVVWDTQAPLHDFINHELLDAAGVKNIGAPSYQYDDELKPFLQQFLDDAKKYKVDIPAEKVLELRQMIYVDQLSSTSHPGVMAACNRYRATQATVSGNRPLKWMVIEVLQEAVTHYAGTGKSRLILLREVMYHELFHCLMSKGHLPQGVSGIMSATFRRGDNRAHSQWDKLVTEMFSPEQMDIIPNVE